MKSPRALPFEIFDKSPNTYSHQGIAVRDGYFYITEDIKDRVWQVKTNGQAVGEILKYPSRYLECIDYTGDQLLLTSDQGSKKIVTFWRPK